ncbi:MAG: site-specific DNA-methyltransferase [Methanomassiliicoccales archaeon]|nr:MAG: site-specific DNA-methyltransferase [Methanomassiliicoccales archaeon]
MKHSQSDSNGNGGGGVVVYKSFGDEILPGDCQKVLKRFSNDTFDLIITSPPYADRRKKTYGGMHPDKYVEWFMPRAKEFQRVLKPTGTFILNVKEIAVKGERHTYVIDLIKEMREQEWLWTEEYIWHKKNCYPGKWPNRFRDAWERCLQFNKQKKFAMYQEAVMEQVGDWAQTRLSNLSETDKIRDESDVGSGFGKRVANWLGREMVYPTNVLHLSTECGNVGHSAAFPLSLPDWFIRLFTKEGDLVLDPFSGSGTVGVAAKRLNRNFVLIDIEPQYEEIARERVGNEARTERRNQKGVTGHSQEEIRSLG